MNSADLCRRNGWKPGTVIEGMRAGIEVWDRVVITEVGETSILGKVVAIKRGRKDGRSGRSAKKPGAWWTGTGERSKGVKS